MAPRILVVEDDSSIVGLYQEIFSEEGWLIDIGHFAELAQSSVTVGSPDVILLDWMLGNQPAGYSVVQRLQANAVTRRIPVVICTAAAKRVAEVEPELTMLGIQIIIKPFPIDTLLMIVRAAMSAGELATEPRASA